MPETAQTKHLRRRRALGLCGWKGCKVRSGKDYYCEPHAAKQAQRMKNAREGA